MFMYIFLHTWAAIPCSTSQICPFWPRPGVTEPFPSSLPYCIHLVCLGPPSSLLFVPTIHVSDVHPPLTSRWLNTAIQVNNMNAQHLINNGNIYIIQCYFMIFLLHFFYTFGQAGWPRPLMSRTQSLSLSVFVPVPVGLSQSTCLSVFLSLVICAPVSNGNR
jgi:hypothetical protein